jgi:polysaccharide deacetylase 2 family uncharacterized protein YibQ
MNRLPIESARDLDLRHSLAAMLRAAQDARQVARQTGTAIVISHGGLLELVSMPALPPESAPEAQDPSVASGGTS